MLVINLGFLQKKEIAKKKGKKDTFTNRIINEERLIFQISTGRIRKPTILRHPIERVPTLVKPRLRIKRKRGGTREEGGGLNRGGWLPGSTSADIHLRDPIRQDRYVSRHLTSLPALNRMPGYSHACQFQPLACHVTPPPPLFYLDSGRDLCVNVNIVAGEIRVAVWNCCTRSAQTLFPPVCQCYRTFISAKEHFSGKGVALHASDRIDLYRELGIFFYGFIWRGSNIRENYHTMICKLRQQTIWLE